MRDTKFSRRGLGYALVMNEHAAEISVGRLSKSRGEYHGLLRVSSALPGVRSVDGVLFVARENLSSDASRKRIAKGLGERTNGANIDWMLYLDQFCLQVLGAESLGREVEYVGMRPPSVGVAFALAPYIPARMTTIIYGDGSTGKSTLAAAMAVSVQTGLTVIPGWSPRPANVLYLDWETWPDDLDAKVKSIASGAHIEDDVQLMYRACALPMADEMESLSRIVTDNAIGFIVVDSAGLAAGNGDGDFQDTAFRLFACFRELGDLGATTLLIDHITKSAAEDQSKPSRPYGSAYKGYLARCTYEVRRSEGNEGRSSIGIYPTKYNIGLRPKPIGLAVEFGAGLIRYEQEAISGELSKGLSQWQQIAAVLREGALSAPDISEAVGLDQNKVRAVLSEGQKVGRFAKLQDGRWGLRAS